MTNRTVHTANIKRHDTTEWHNNDPELNEELPYKTAESNPISKRCNNKIKSNFSVTKTTT